MTLTNTGPAVELIDSFAAGHDKLWQGLGECGTWWSGTDRVAAVAEGRQALCCELCRTRSEVLSPMMVPGEHDSISNLSAPAIDLIHRLATDPGRLSRKWASQIIDSMTEEAYVELVTVNCIQYVIDSFSRCLGLPLRELPQAGEGIPSRIRPDGVGDVGAWVSQSLDKSLANVSRAASLVPDTESLWRELVQMHYSRGPEFADLVWDRALSRPQVELLASTVSALNECFY